MFAPKAIFFPGMKSASTYDGNGFVGKQGLPPHTWSKKHHSLTQSIPHRPHRPFNPQKANKNNCRCWGRVISCPVMRMIANAAWLLST